MLLSLRDGYVRLITSGSQLLLLLVALRINDLRVWPPMLGLIGGISFAAWMAAYRRARAIADTPTSKIASAAQGYVELYGRASDRPENLVQAKAGSLPCVWFRCVTYRRNAQNKWEVVSRRISDSLFELDDGSGRCLVDPEGAEVVGAHRRTWYSGDYRHVEDQLLANDSLYVIGEFTTLGGAHTALNAREDVAALLAEWKRDRLGLLARFDRNRDGEIDLQEWELARRAARREVERQHHELRQQSGVHVMRRSASGRLFLLSNRTPQQLRRTYRRWSLFHLVLFLVSLAALTWTAVQLGLAGLQAALW